MTHYPLSLVLSPAVLAGARDWLGITDPDDENHEWLFDVAWFTSGYTCIFGKGCQGIKGEPTPEENLGCCIHGAHFTDKDDLKRVKKAVKKLTPEQWQFHDKGSDGSWLKENKDGEFKTKVHKGGCIFANRNGFDRGPGCAFHVMAIDDGVDHVQYKPDVCWQLPIRREDHELDDGGIVTTVTQWERKHWGDGGAEFAWWCTEAPEAYIGTEPVWKSMRPELVQMCGEAVWTLLDQTLRERTVQGWEPMPHPVVRTGKAQGVTAENGTSTMG